jgi:hypothetical protein
MSKVIADAEQLTHPFEGLHMPKWTAELQQVTEGLATLERLEALEKCLAQSFELQIQEPILIWVEKCSLRKSMATCEQKYAAQVRESQLRPKPFELEVERFMHDLAVILGCIILALTAFAVGTVLDNDKPKEVLDMAKGFLVLVLLAVITCTVMEGMTAFLNRIIDEPEQAPRGPAQIEEEFRNRRLPASFYDAILSS